MPTLPAPDLETLMNFEDAIETKCAQVFAALGFVTSASQSNERRTTPRVEFSLSVGASREHYIVISGKLYNDAWNGTLRCAVISNRKSDTGHSAHRAKVRALMQKAIQGIFNTDYLIVVEAVDSGTAVSIQADQNEDISQLDFKIVFNVKTEAWPVSP